jgi:hypothetical protein
MAAGGEPQRRPSSDPDRAMLCSPDLAARRHVLGIRSSDLAANGERSPLFKVNIHQCQNREPQGRKPVEDAQSITSSKALVHDRTARFLGFVTFSFLSTPFNFFNERATLIIL